MSGPKSMLEATVLLNSAGSAANNFNKLNERSSNLAVTAGRAKRDSIVAMINRVYDSDIQVTPGFVQMASRYTTRSVDPSRIASVPDYSARVLSEISSAGLGAYVQNPELQNFMQLVIRKDLNPAVVEKTVKQVEDSGIAPLDPVLAAEVLLSESKTPQTEEETSTRFASPFELKESGEYTIGSDTASVSSESTEVSDKFTTEEIENYLDTYGTHEEQDEYASTGRISRDFIDRLVSELLGPDVEYKTETERKKVQKKLERSLYEVYFEGREKTHKLQGALYPRVKVAPKLDVTNPEGKVSTVASTTGGLESSGAPGVSGTVTEVIQIPVRPRRGGMGPVEMASAGVGSTSSAPSPEPQVASLEESERESDVSTLSAPSSASEQDSEPYPDSASAMVEGLPEDSKPSETERPEGDVLFPKDTSEEFTPAVYHKEAITVFFNSSEKPSWDPQLSANIKNAYKDSSTESLKDLIKNLIFTEGQNFLVIRPKSDGTLQELVEIIQLLFSSKRNMSRGPRVPMAGISLGSLLAATGKGRSNTRVFNHDGGAGGGGGGAGGGGGGGSSYSSSSSSSESEVGRKRGGGTGKQLLNVVTPDDLLDFKVPIGDPNSVPVDTPTAIKNAADSYQRSANFHGFGSTGPRIIYPVLTGAMNKDTVGPGLTWLDQFPKGTKFKINLDPCE